MYFIPKSSKIIDTKCELATCQDYSVVENIHVVPLGWPICRKWFALFVLIVLLTLTLGYNGRLQRPASTLLSRPLANIYCVYPLLQPNSSCLSYYFQGCSVAIHFQNSHLTLTHFNLSPSCPIHHSPSCPSSGSYMKIISSHVWVRVMIHAELVQ